MQPPFGRGEERGDGDLMGTGVERDFPRPRSSRGLGGRRLTSAAGPMESISDS